MTGYTILKPENLHDSLKGKPRWLICVVFTAGLLIMTLLAVAAGVFIGYTYCYVEHRTGLTGFRAAGNVSQTQDLRIFNGDSQAANPGRFKDENSINGALMSSQLVQRMLKIGHTLWNDDHAYLPGPHDDKYVDKLERET